MKIFAIFGIFFVLFFSSAPIFGQSADNLITIELSKPTFSLERPFTISVIIAHSETRPTLTFPDIPGFVKKGTSASVTTAETGGKTVTNQIITQNYQALAPGRYRLPPFTITVNGEVAQAGGIVLVVQPPATASLPASSTLPTAPPNGAAFLTLQTSKSRIYMGEGVGLTLSFFVADNYPYILDFKALNQQLQTITRKIRPANTWEENQPITELEPVPVLVGGKKFRQYRLYQSVFFPLSNQALRLPAVSLWLAQTRPVIGPPSSEPERVAFSSKPVTVAVRPLPPHPLRGRVPVGQFRLEEELDRKTIGVGQSVRYRFAVVGEGNIAALPAPTPPVEGINLDVFPPQERQTLNRLADRVTGRKTFTYFIVPRQNGLFSLAKWFQWIYFDPQTARYDTLRAGLQLRAGGSGPTFVARAEGPVSASGVEAATAVSAGNSLYAGIENMDSTRQPTSGPGLIRAGANLLILLMLLGMIFVFFKK